MSEPQTTHIRYGRHDGRAHLVAGPAHPGGPSLCGLGPDDLEDGIQLTYACERCYAIADEWHLDRS